MPRTANRTGKREVFESDRESALRHWRAIRTKSYHLCESEARDIKQVSHDVGSCYVKSQGIIIGRTKIPRVQLGPFYRYTTPMPINRSQPANVTSKASKVFSTEPTTGLEVLQEFEKYAREIIVKKNAKLSSVNIREWMSLEDSTWKQLIIDFVVEADADTSLTLWDDLSEELTSFLETQYRDQASQLHELLSVTVEWR